MRRKEQMEYIDCSLEVDLRLVQMFSLSVLQRYNGWYCG